MAAAQPKKIRMVAGLGNPGDEYADTRHNAGFQAIDELARQANVTSTGKTSSAPRLPPSRSTTLMRGAAAARSCSSSRSLT